MELPTTAGRRAGIDCYRLGGGPEEFAALVRHIVANGMLDGEVTRLDGAHFGPRECGAGRR